MPKKRNRRKDVQAAKRAEAERLLPAEEKRKRTLERTRDAMIAAVPGRKKSELFTRISMVQDALSRRDTSSMSKADMRKMARDYARRPIAGAD